MVDPAPSAVPPQESSFFLPHRPRRFTLSLVSSLVFLGARGRVGESLSWLIFPLDPRRSRELGLRVFTVWFLPGTLPGAACSQTLGTSGQVRGRSAAQPPAAQRGIPMCLASEALAGKPRDA